MWTARRQNISILHALGRRVLARIELDAYGCQLPQEIVDNRPAVDAELRVAAPEDVPALAALLRPAGSVLVDFVEVEDFATDLRRRYDRGDVCVLAILKSRIVHAGWIRFGDASMPRLGIRARLDSDEAYIYGGYTLPEFRGRGLQRAGIAERMRQMRLRGISKAFRWVRSTDERTSLARDLGWRFIGRVTQLLWRPRRVGLAGVVTVAVAPIDPLSTFMSPRRLRLVHTSLVLRRYDETLATRRPTPMDSDAGP